MEIQNDATIKTLLLDEHEFITTMLTNKISLQQQHVNLIQKINCKFSYNHYYFNLLQVFPDEYYYYKVAMRIDEIQKHILMFINKNLDIKEIYEKLLKMKLLYLRGYKKNIDYNTFLVYLQNEKMVYLEENLEEIKVATIDTPPKINTTENEKIEVKTPIIDKYADFQPYIYHNEYDSFLNKTASSIREKEFENLNNYSISYLFEEYITQKYHSYKILERRFFYFDTKMLSENMYDKLLKLESFKNYDLIGFENQKSSEMIFYRYYDKALLELTKRLKSTDFRGKDLAKRGILNSFGVLNIQ